MTNVVKVLAITNDFVPRLWRGKTIVLRALYGMDGYYYYYYYYFTTRDQHGLADSSINYTPALHTVYYQHSALRASHSCECTALQHDRMTGHLCA